MERPPHRPQSACRRFITRHPWVTSPIRTRASAMRHGPDPRDGLDAPVSRATTKKWRSALISVPLVSCSLRTRLAPPLASISSRHGALWRSHFALFAMVGRWMVALPNIVSIRRQSPVLFVVGDVVTEHAADRSKRGFARASYDALSTTEMVFVDSRIWSQLREYRSLRRRYRVARQPRLEITLRDRTSLGDVLLKIP